MDLLDALTPDEVKRLLGGHMVMKPLSEKEKKENEAACRKTAEKFTPRKDGKSALDGVAT